MWWSNMRKQSIKERKHFKFKNITAMMTKLCFLQTLFLLLSSFLFCITKKLKRRETCLLRRMDQGETAIWIQASLNMRNAFFWNLCIKPSYIFKSSWWYYSNLEIMYANVTCDVIQSLWTWMRMGVFHAGDNRINYSNE